MRQILPFLIDAQYSIVYIFYNFFIYSSIVRCLGCFHILTIVLSIIMNKSVHMSFQVIVLLLVYMLRSGTAGTYKRSILNFWRTFSIFLTWTKPNNFPTKNIWKFIFIIYLTNNRSFQSSDICYPHLGQMIAHCCFELHFLHNKLWWTIILMTAAHRFSSENFISSPTFDGVIGFFLVIELLQCFIYFVYYPFTAH